MGGGLSLGYFSITKVRGVQRYERYEEVRGVQFPGGKRYVTLERPLITSHTKFASYCPAIKSTFSLWELIHGFIADTWLQIIATYHRTDRKTRDSGLTNPETHICSPTSWHNGIIGTIHYVTLFSGNLRPILIHHRSSNAINVFKSLHLPSSFFLEIGHHKTPIV